MGIMVSRVSIQGWTGGGAGLWVQWLAGLVRATAMFTGVVL
jgi:hypothetical protein